MVEIKNIGVFGLDRAKNAITNSYSIGEINTNVKCTDKVDLIACRLGSNCEPLQSHDAFLSGIRVMFDFKYPLYLAPEFQRYHWFDIVMSQSTMHSLSKMLTDDLDPYNKYVLPGIKCIISTLVQEYVDAVKTKDKDLIYEKYITLRSNLPSGFELWETISTNYLQLKRMCIQRKGHKLREDWGKFREICITKLPEFSTLTGIKE